MQSDEQLVELAEFLMAARELLVLVFEVRLGGLVAAPHHFEFVLLLLPFVVEFVHFVHVGVPVGPLLEFENFHLGDQPLALLNRLFDLILGLFDLPVLVHLDAVKVLDYFNVLGFGLAPLTNLLAEHALVADAVPTLGAIVTSLLDLFLEKPKSCLAPEAVGLLQFSDSGRSHACVHTDF